MGALAVDHDFEATSYWYKNGPVLLPVGAVTKSVAPSSDSVAEWPPVLGPIKVPLAGAVMLVQAGEEMGHDFFKSRE